jgi:hypothetical protein
MKLCYFQEPPSIPFKIITVVFFPPSKSHVYLQFMIMGLNPNRLIKHWSVLCKSLVENIFNLVLVIEKNGALFIDFKRIEEQLHIVNRLSYDCFLRSHVLLTWNTSILWCMPTIKVFLFKTMLIIITKMLSLPPHAIDLDCFVGAFYLKLNWPLCENDIFLQLG